MGGYTYLNCKYCAILYRGVEHLQILVSMEGPGTNSPQILRDDDMYFKNFCLFIYLSLAVLGLHCHMWAFSSCSGWEILSGCGAWASHCRGFSRCRARAPGHTGISSFSTQAQQFQLLGSRAQAQQLRHSSLAALQHVGSSRNQGSNPCILHWQMDSLPLGHQGSPNLFLQ